ncbi:hypothetical protein Poli38472_011958 [Pythium oligandrum]|uniref:Protein kinase domain-containing protein n=1 Tax=Pythium oligandrum TaxID=41045 RepID=A0A8K1FPE6_PYTOL|nr:hypothetical protein Poli38472_011958 [Pythium oligandrum]|eukprot:TMW66842.1 hypothetical protein Poli38472_011958 [Pythium oligandrum]
MLSASLFLSTLTLTHAMDARVAPDVRHLRRLAIEFHEAGSFPDAPQLTDISCALMDLSYIDEATFVENNECATKTTYRWGMTVLPNAQQQRELCTCTALIKKVQMLELPRCLVYISDDIYTYKQVIEYSFARCTSSSGDSDSGSSSESASSSGSESASSTASSSTSASSGSGSTPSAPSPQTTKGEDFFSTLTPQVSSEEKKSGSNVGLIAGIGGGALVIVILIIFLICRCRKKSKNSTTKQGAEFEDLQHVVPSPQDLEMVAGDYAAYGQANNSKSNSKHSATKSTNASSSVPSGGSGPRPTDAGLWDDSMIIAVRIPLEAITFGALINRGGYGEVYKGVYKNEVVAIKQLLPDRRKDLSQIDSFLAEAKLLASLEHERIVRFVGVAWNSLSDLCVVTEFMDNGDLRSVLTRFENEERRQHGFDSDKLKIALHVAHALTYLHSLQPIVVHRDLKSKNILLTSNYDAKLTDFGVSRERTDSTMTAGVGSSLWMAPEVMLGERYDEKADVFSFGVVLSELDSHRLPYWDAKELGTGRRLPDTAILQMVSLGRLSVSFTEYADEDLMLLGQSCVRLDPTQRPTIAEVLHRVHQAARRLA